MLVFPDAVHDARMVDRRMALAREWDELVEQVRALEGFEDFLRPPKLERLLPAAEGGPVVLVNVSRWRCDALIVKTSGVEVEPLPGLTMQGVAEQTTAYLRELHAVERAAKVAHDVAEEVAEKAARRSAGFPVPEADLHDLQVASETALRDLEQAAVECDRGLLDILEWLWDNIADPVLRHLGYTTTPGGDVAGWPRLWWCPTGLLTLLPLHAAGYHREKGGSRAVIDRVVSSYTPTLRALMQARQPRAQASGADRILIVAEPKAPNLPPLPAVAQERDMLMRQFASRFTLLQGEDANIDNVGRELPAHRWVHFGCHGGQDLTDPSKGGVALSDGTLSVAAISAVHGGGDFAFLCACKTATGGLNLPDEAMSLTAALHYAGYRHVIGTLWSVYDKTSAELAEAVYTDLLSTGQFEPDRAAYALHRALRELRTKSLLGPTVWTPYTHTGP